MSNIPTVALTNTFDYWRIQTNSTLNKLNRLSTSSATNGIYHVFANTITANVSLAALGTATITGLLTASGRATIGTNLTVSGNTTLGAAAKQINTTGLHAHTGRSTISTNLVVSGNTTSNKSTVTSSLTSSGNTTISGILMANGAAGTNNWVLKTSGTGIWWGPAAGTSTAAYLQVANAVATYQTKAIERAALANTNIYIATKLNTAGPASSGLHAHTGRSTISTNLTVSGNTTLGAAAKQINTTGLHAHTGRSTISTNLAVTGNTSSNKITVAASLIVSGNTTLGAAAKQINTTGLHAHTGRSTISTNLVVSGNTTSNKSTVTSSLTSSGNTTISGILMANGAAGTNNWVLKTSGTGIWWGPAAGTSTAAYLQVANAVATYQTKAIERAALANTNIYIATKLNTAGPASSGLHAHTGRSTISTNLTVSGNTTLGAAAKQINTTGLHAHTGRSTISTNLVVSGNSQIASLGVGTAGSGVAGEIRATNEITSFYSDDRLKIRIGNIPNALDKVNSLNGFYFRPNEIATGLGFQDKDNVGVSAQEVQAVLSEVVVPAPISNTYLTVHYERLVPLLIEAIKELTTRVEELEEEIL